MQLATETNRATIGVENLLVKSASTTGSCNHKQKRRLLKQRLIAQMTSHDLLDGRKYHILQAKMANPRTVCVLYVWGDGHAVDFPGIFSRT